MNTGIHVATESAGASGFSLSSKDFVNGGAIPRELACASQGGANRSPQLSWGGAPEGTVGYALFMEDEDPPCGSGDGACVHWSVFNLPASASQLASGASGAMGGLVEGINYSGRTGYAGPCPPAPHTYHLTVFALGAGMPAVDSGVRLTSSRFRQRYGQYILGSASTEGLFTP